MYAIEHLTKNFEPRERLKLVRLEKSVLSAGKSFQVVERLFGNIKLTHALRSGSYR